MVVGRVPKNVIDKEMYVRAREKVKKKVSSYPSAYARAQIVNEYKKMGGRYRGSDGDKLTRWFDEKWIDVSTGRQCGRKNVKNMTKKEFKDTYPLCRPSRRVSKKTPMTKRQMERKYKKSGIKSKISEKRKRGTPKKGRARRISL